MSDNNDKGLTFSQKLILAIVSGLFLVCAAIVGVNILWQPVADIFLRNENLIQTQTVLGITQTAIASRSQIPIQTDNEFILDENPIRTQIAREIAQTAGAVVSQAPNASTPTPVAHTKTPEIEPPTIQEASPTWQPSCNWERDWSLQADGQTYIWTGLPLDPELCWKIGIMGDILKDVKSGVNYTFIIDVGDQYFPIDICVGEFDAERVIPGEECVFPNYAYMPQVSGIVTVTNSTGPVGGFAIGTDR